MTSPAPQRFSFDTVFDLDGGAYHPPRPKRVYSADEVEAVRQAAFAEGQASAVSQAEQSAAAALREVAGLARAALTALAEAAHDHRTASANLALVCARKIADVALDHAPEAPAVAALQALARELEACPRLVVHASPEDAPRLAKALEDAAAQAGFAGSILLKPEAGRHRAAFVFDWGDGRAAFDPTEAADRVAAALETALAVEGMHAEVVVPSADVSEGTEP
jgi:flagellar assembly protein FliH